MSKGKPTKKMISFASSLAEEYGLQEPDYEDFTDTRLFLNEYAPQVIGEYQALMTKGSQAILQALEQGEDDEALRMQIMDELKIDMPKVREDLMSAGVPDMREYAQGMFGGTGQSMSKNFKPVASGDDKPKDEQKPNQGQGKGGGKGFGAPPSPNGKDGMSKAIHSSAGGYVDIKKFFDFINHIGFYNPFSDTPTTKTITSAQKREEYLDNAINATTAFRKSVEDEQQQDEGIIRSSFNLMQDSWKKAAKKGALDEKGLNTLKKHADDSLDKVKDGKLKDSLIEALKSFFESVKKIVKRVTQALTP